MQPQGSKSAPTKKWDTQKLQMHACTQRHLLKLLQYGTRSLPCHQSESPPCEREINIPNAKVEHWLGITRYRSNFFYNCACWSLNWKNQKCSGTLKENITPDREQSWPSYQALTIYVHKRLWRKAHTLENSSSGTCNFFWIRTLTSAKVSPSWMIKKKGSPKFWTCCCSQTGIESQV